MSLWVDDGARPTTLASTPARVEFDEPTGAAEGLAKLAAEGLAKKDWPNCRTPVRDLAASNANIAAALPT